MCVCIRLYVRCLYAQPRYSHAAHPLGGSVANLLGRVGVSVLPPRRVSLLYGTFLPLSLTLPWTVCCDGRTSSALCAFAPTRPLLVLLAFPARPPFCA